MRAVVGAVAVDAMAGLPALNDLSSGAAQKIDGAVGSCTQSPLNEQPSSPPCSNIGYRVMVFVALRRLKFQFEGRSSMQEPREGGAASSSMPRQLDPIRGFRALDKSDESAGWLPGPVTTLRTRNAAVNDRPIANTSHKLTMVHSYSTGNTTTTTQWAREAILTTTTKTKMSTTRLARGSVAALVTPERSARTKKERTNNLGTCEDADNGERDGDDESDSGNEVPRNRFEEKRACKHTGEMLGSTVYEDGDKVYRGAVDTRGITPFVTFTSSETPPSQVKSKIVTSSQHPTCGFCNSSNLLWILRCSFCGSARMSDAPRLKYLVDTILSVNPLIKAEEVGICFLSINTSRVTHCLS